MRRPRISILALIVGLLLPIPAGAAAATLLVHVTNNDERLPNPRQAKIHIYEPGKRESYVAWGHAESPVSVPEGTYDLLVIYSNDTIRVERVFEKVELLGETEREIPLQIPVAQLTVFLTSGGNPVPRGTGSYSVYQAGRRGKPLAARRPGMPVTLRRGSYDIEVTFRDLEGLQRNWIEGLYVEETREEVVEVGTTSARLSLTAVSGGHALPDGAARWRVFRPGERESWLAERRSGDSLVLEAGVYDVGLFFDYGGTHGQRWLVGLEVTGDVRRQVDIAMETASLAVTIRHRGSMLSGAWFSVFSPGGQGAPRAFGANGSEVQLEPGTYDVLCRYVRDGMRVEQWERGKEVQGRAELGVEMNYRAASLRVEAPERRGSADAGGSTNLLLVVDSSGEMADSLGVRTRLEQVARMTDEAIHNFSGSEVRLGLRAFGIMPGSLHDCKDTTLLIPVDPYNPRAISGSLTLLRPSGQSPIAHTLTEAASDFPPGDDNIVVLITGTTDSCGGDPCAAATELLRTGAVSRIYVLALSIGFDRRERLDCIGDYRMASSASELKAGLREIFREVLRTGSGTVSLFESDGGRWVASGSIGDRIELNPGRYNVLIRTGGQTFSWTDVKISGFVEAAAGPRPPRSN